MLLGWVDRIETSRVVEIGLLILHWNTNSYQFIIIHIKSLNFQLEYAKMLLLLDCTEGFAMLEYNDDKWIGIEDAAEYLCVNKDSFVTR